MKSQRDTRQYAIFDADGNRIGGFEVDLSLPLPKRRVYVDPDNGDDANDGATPQTAKRTLSAVAESQPPRG